MNIEAQVKTITAEHICVPLELLTDNADLTKNLGVDSMDAVDLLLALNEAFHLHLPAEKLDKVNTVADLVRFVQDGLNDACAA